MPWLDRLCADPARVAELLDAFGSPVHLHRPLTLVERAGELAAGAARVGGRVDLFFARKANKALAWVDAARDAGLGVDVASELELTETLDAGVGPERIVLTAAVKSRALLERAARSGVTVVLDHVEEIGALAATASAAAPVPVALRLRGFDLGSRPVSRFGIDLARVDDAVDRLTAPPVGRRVRLEGLHFHLDGYDPADRLRALAAATAVSDRLRTRGLELRYVDMGGGIPVTYVPDETRWRAFVEALHAGVAGRGPAVTWPGAAYGLHAVDGRVVGSPDLYPQHETPTGGDWVARVLGAPDPAGGGTVADALRTRGLELRAEPGRALLAGGGATVARVAYVKPADRGEVFVGVEMNALHARSRKSESVVDPWLVRAPGSSAGAAVEGWVVGSCCAEGDRISSRRFRFPGGVRAGDALVLPDTAGYLMHFVESPTHRIPLPRNGVVDERGRVGPDSVDVPPPVSSRRTR